jgi:uncharacterized protein YdaU (DUF1376 family)
VKHYPHHIGDFDKATRHLTRIERSVYRDLIDLYYDTEHRLTLDKAALCRRIIARSDDESTAVEQVLNEFFTETPTGWYHDRCEEEIEAYRSNNSQKAIAGKASAEARRLKNQQAMNGISTAVQQPLKSVGTDFNGASTNQSTNQPINQEEISKLSLASPRPLAESAPEPEQAKPGKPAIPDCPHLEILELWAEVLPALPQHSPSLWNGARSAHLRARWRETASAKGWTAKEQGLAYFRRVFTLVGNSNFLTGRVPNRDPTKRPFLIELEWLVSPGNWAKVLEGKYSEEVAEA